MTEPPVATPRPKPVVATGPRRWLYLSLGFACLGFATAGAFLPLLPCTPWVIAAGWFFDRSSERFNRWLRRLPYFGHILKDWERHRAIRRWVKFTAVACVTGFVSLAALVLLKELWQKWLVIVLGVTGVCVIMFVVKTVQTLPPDRGEPGA